MLKEMLSQKQNPPCLFLDKCPIGGNKNRCTIKTMGTCGEAAIMGNRAKKPCPFLGNCSSGGSSSICFLAAMDGCDEVIQRQKRANQNCPLMEKSGGENQKCHVPQLLPFLPLKFPCYDGDDCILCKIVPEIVAEVAKHNFESGRSKMSEEDLERAGAAVIEAVKTRQTKGLEKADANTKVAV